MKIYSGGRHNGKTTKLIIDAELHDRVILVGDRQRARTMEEMAGAMGRSIRQPITFEDLKRSRLMGSYVRKLLIDDAETVLQGMIADYTGGRGIVDGITITTWEPLYDEKGGSET